MREKLTIAILTAVFVLVPPPVKAANFSDSVFTTGEDSGMVLASLELDKEKPSQREKKEKEEKGRAGGRNTVISDWRNKEGASK